jgi:hypothetical protein
VFDSTPEGVATTPTNTPHTNFLMAMNVNTLAHGKTSIGRIMLFGNRIMMS